MRILGERSLNDKKTMKTDFRLKHYIRQDMKKKEEFQKKEKFHKKRAEYYKKKVDEIDKSERQIGFKW